MSTFNFIPTFNNSSLKTGLQPFLKLEQDVFWPRKFLKLNTDCTQQFIFFLFPFNWNLNCNSFYWSGYSGFKVLYLKSRNLDFLNEANHVDIVILLKVRCKADFLHLYNAGFIIPSTKLNGVSQGGDSGGE